jgi:flagellar biosynthesis/type III secretory pathway protein FliH
MATDPVTVDFGQLTPSAAHKPAPSLEHAALKARALVAAAEAEADRIRLEARSAGHAEGFAAGREDALQEMAPTVQAALETLAAVHALEGDHADRVEQQAVELAMQVAERVVAGTVAVEPARVLDVVRGALRTLVERERVTVLVHPDDVELLREGFPDLEVYEERRVRRGGAIVRTAYGEIDARLETKLDRARETIVKELAS